MGKLLEMSRPIVIHLESESIPLFGAVVALPEAVLDSIINIEYPRGGQADTMIILQNNPERRVIADEGVQNNFEFKQFVSVICYFRPVRERCVGL